MIEKQGKRYELVAKASGKSYSMLLQREKVWRHFEERIVPEYEPFANYQPHHLKTLKRGLKLFLEEHWPAYAKQTRRVNAEISKTKVKSQHVQIA